MTHRLPEGGRVDRSAPLRFTFDGTEYTGLRGDTLASALLANGVVQAATNGSAADGNFDSVSDETIVTSSVFPSGPL